VSEAVFARFVQIQKAAAKVRKKARKHKKVSYVLANIYNHQGRDILLLVSLMGWKAK
jgi:hypothetical protein